MEKEQQSPPKRRPGRPEGSTKFLASDMRLLRKAAKKMADNKKLTLTAALRLLEVSEKKDLARLRQRWANLDRDLIAEVKADKFRSAEGGFWYKFALGIHGLMDRIAEVRSTLPLREVVARYDDLDTTIDVLRKQGGIVPLPFDPTNPEELGAAIARLELRDRAKGSAIKASVDAQKDPPEWEKSYAMAVAMHERALALRAEALAQEQHMEETSDDETPKN